MPRDCPEKIVGLKQGRSRALMNVARLATLALLKLCHGRSCAHPCVSSRSLALEATTNTTRLPACHKGGNHGS